MKNTIKLVMNDWGDWEILLLNGTIYDEDHSISHETWISLLNELGHEATMKEVTDEEMEKVKEQYVKIDLKLIHYLQHFDQTVEGIDEAFAYLIQSLSGDQYYLCEWLPEQNIISADLGAEVFEIVQGMTGTEIFNLRNEVVDKLAIDKEDSGI